MANTVRMMVIAIFRVIKAPFIDENLSIIDCYAEAVHVFRNFVHVIKNRLVGAPVHVIEKTVHVHENCCSRVLRILKLHDAVRLDVPDEGADGCAPELLEVLLHDLRDLLAEGFDVDLAGAATEVLGDALAGGVVGSCGLEEFVDEEREDERRVDIPVRLEAVEVSAEIRVEPQGPEAVDGLGMKLAGQEAQVVEKLFGAGGERGAEHELHGKRDV